MEGAAWMRGRLHERRGFPAAAPSRSRGARLEGELWRIDARPGVLAPLDEYEEVRRGLFVRRRVTVHRAPASVVRAWAYLAPHQR